MNFLAHLHLSGNNEGIKIGNFIADFVKGKNHEEFPAAVKQGIIIHRHIDYFTDTHPIVLESKQRLYSTYHKYSGAIVDVFYDHFLATKWDLFSDIPLFDFSSEFYFMVKKHSDYLPDKVKEFLPYMIEQDWLINYRNFNGIGKALNGMARRTTFESGMENALTELRQYYGDFKREFLLYYPELITYVKGLIHDFESGQTDN
ncbi:MAG TPA: ACP phosphodiesterase [Cytophagales bacterium]|nr:ACP phosphodiesterase [Cytophagales bacterium]